MYDKLLINFGFYHKYRVSDGFFDLDIYKDTLLQSRVAHSAQGSSSNIRYYRCFLEKIRSIVGLQLVPLSNLLSGDTSRGSVVAFRYDIDIDPEVGLLMARENARFGVPGSFYFLHTAYYYGQMKRRIFYRNPLMSEWCKSFIVAGCEIGLHLDPFTLYKNYNIDGAQAVKEEIQWLREQGVNIKGVAAHNSYPVYGAENFEIFDGLVIGKRKSVSNDGVRIPLGVLNMQKLGLSYEGNYPVVKTHPDKEKVNDWLNHKPGNCVLDEIWMRAYMHDNPCYDRNFDVMIWFSGGDRWVLSCTKQGNEMYEWQIDGERLFRILTEIKSDMRIVFLFHPIYFSGYN